MYSSNEKLTSSEFRSEYLTWDKFKVTTIEMGLEV